MEHIHGEEQKPQPFERLRFLLGHKTRAVVAKSGHTELP